MMAPLNDCNLEEHSSREGHAHDAVSTTTTTTPNPPESDVGLKLKQAKEYSEEQWRRAACVLYENPALMTSKILMMALCNHAPLHIVRFMLEVNPNAASVPKKGFTALQVAVRNHASIEVIRAVIEACPLAIFAANEGTECDPLAYAKIWRQDESHLIELLSKPVSYWLVQPRPTTANGTNDPLQVATSDSAYWHESLSDGNQQELENLKFITATIVKTQKRQMHALEEQRQEIHSFLQGQEHVNEIERSNRLRLLEQGQHKQFKTQLIALDMKEQAMKAQFRDMERRIVHAIQVAKTERSLREHDQAVTIQRLKSSLASMNLRVRNWERNSQLPSHQLVPAAMAGRNKPFPGKPKRIAREPPPVTVQELYREYTEQGQKSEDPVLPFVYATPYPADDESARMMELDEGEPLVGTVSPKKKKLLRRMWLSPKKKYFVSM